MRPPSPRFLGDSCVVYAPPVEAYDAEGAPSLLDGEPSEAMPCQMDAASASGQPSTRMGTVEPYGLSRRVVRFASDPGVTQADQKLVVTTAGGVVVTLRTVGPVDGPYSIQNIWDVPADIKA